MWECLTSLKVSFFDIVLILVCVEVSVGVNLKPHDDIRLIVVLILVCVEVSVGVDKPWMWNLARIVLILVCVEVSVGVTLISL